MLVNRILVVSMLLMTLLRTCRCHGHDVDIDPDAPIENKLNQDGFINDREHIQEHLAGTAKFDLDNATPEEMEFHFFKLHDSNSDNRLDGLELLAALSHGTDSYIQRMQDKSTPLTLERIQKLYDGIARTVDKILVDEDADDNGYLSYVEYANSRRTTARLKAAAKTMNSPQGF